MKIHSLFQSVLFFCLLSCSAFAGDFASLNLELLKAWPKNRAINIVFHGHSVPSGYHKTPDVRTFESYPHLVHVKLKELYPNAVINVILTSIGGEDSVAGAKRFKADVFCHKPDLIFIDYALNDRRKPVGKVEESWRSMIEESKKAGVPVVLLTPTGDSAADMKQANDPLRLRADLIRKLGKETGVSLADVSAAWLAETGKGTSETELLAQSNHPNLKGHSLAAETIMKTLAESGLKP